MCHRAGSYLLFPKVGGTVKAQIWDTAGQERLGVGVSGASKLIVFVQVSCNH